MQNITAAKQVGSLSYMVESQTILDLILCTGRIKSSQKPERNPNTGEESKFVSFSRNMTSAAIRNSKRWRWGVIIDGDRLSDRYSIVPISFVGVLTNKNSANFKVKCITKYDSGKCVLTCINWPSIEIRENLYNTIKQMIEACPESYKELKQLKIKREGKRKTSNGYIVEQYLFNVKTGGIILNRNTLQDNLSDFVVHSSFNEQEERIWTNSEFIDIKNCISGIIVPKQRTADEDAEYEGLIATAKVVAGDHFQLIEY